MLFLFDQEDVMRHRTFYDRHPFIAGLCGALDLFGDQYRRATPYPHESEQAALARDWLVIAGDVRVAADAFRARLNAGEFSRQLPLIDYACPTADSGKRERA